MQNARATKSLLSGPLCVLSWPVHGPVVSLAVPVCLVFGLSTYVSLPVWPMSGTQVTRMHTWYAHGLIRVCHTHVLARALVTCCAQLVRFCDMFSLFSLCLACPRVLFLAYLACPQARTTCDCSGEYGPPTCWYGTTMWILDILGQKAHACAPNCIPCAHVLQNLPREKSKVCIFSQKWSKTHLCTRHNLA